MRESLAPSRPAPAWLIDHSYEDHRLGVLKSGKEAEVFLVERRSPNGSCLLAHKRYRPRYPSAGDLRELGFSKATHYRHDSVYRAGWNLNARDRRAVRAGTDWGHKVKGMVWPMNELEMLRRAWRGGASVPYPVGATEDGLLMEYIGDADGTAPRLIDARLEHDELRTAFQQVVENLRALTAAWVVHADLSVYNLLWWRGRVVVIDFPQAASVTENVEALDLLRRDVDNVCRWFARRGVPTDAHGLFAGLLPLAF